PPERISDLAAAAAGAERRHPASGALLRAEARARDEETNRDRFDGSDGRALRLRLARKRARARECDRASRDPDERAGPAGASRRAAKAPRHAVARRNPRSDRAGGDPSRAACLSLGPRWSARSGGPSRAQADDAAIAYAEARHRAHRTPAADIAAA